LRAELLARKWPQHGWCVVCMHAEAVHVAGQEGSQCMQASCAVCLAQVHNSTCVVYLYKTRSCRVRHHTNVYCTGMHFPAHVLSCPPDWTQSLPLGNFTPL
jgi:hypothetical protein